MRMQSPIDAFAVLRQVSHTWSHPNLDYLPASECTGKEYTCPTQPERVLAELDYNVKTLTGQGIDSAAYLAVFQGND